jgi:hypothetical protein
VIYSNATFPTPQSGTFDYNPATDTGNLPMPNNWQTQNPVSFCWGASGGADTISVVVTYAGVPGNSPPTTINVKVSIPQNQVFVTMNPGPQGLYPNGNNPPWLSYGTPSPNGPAQAGISWSGSNDAPFTNGIDAIIPNSAPVVPISVQSGGVVQEVTSGDDQVSNGPDWWGLLDEVNNNGQTVNVCPVLDAPVGTVLYWGATATGLDSPGIELANPAPGAGNVDYYVVDLQFTDTFMYKLNGGIWVPIGTWEWSIDMAATLNGNIWLIQPGAIAAFNGNTVAQQDTFSSTVAAAWPSDWNGVGQNFKTWIPL